MAGIKRVNGMWELLLSVVLGLSPAAAVPERSSLADLPRGEPPAVGYVANGVFRGEDGRRVEVPNRYGISSITPYDGGFLVTDTRYFEGSLGLVRVEASGRVVDEEGASSGYPVMARDGRVAWTSFTPPESGLVTPSLVHVDACERSWPGISPFAVAGFVSDHVLVNQGLGVSLLNRDGKAVPLPRLESAFDATGDWVAARFGRGVGVLDLTTREVLWRARGYGLVFSPSGRRVAMTQRDEVMVRRRSDGRVLWRQPSPPGFVDRLTWEDGRHLLAVATYRHEIAIIRSDRNRVERTVPVQRSDFLRPRYVLATAP